MKNLTLAVIAEEFAVGTPAQQLLDRFLSGYPRDGEFHRPEIATLRLHVPGASPGADAERRAREHGLVIATDLERATREADGIIIAPRNLAGPENDQLIESALGNAPRGCRCFVHGALGNSLAAAKKNSDLAEARGVPLLVGTSVSVTWRLPEVELPSDASFQQALIVVQGPSPVAEVEALDGLLPLLERRHGGESGVRSVRSWEGDALWQAGEEGAWSKPLLASAISRSDSPQGDPMRDGRTQDLVGLGLVPKLAVKPRGWLVEHRDGLRSALLVLDGVIADYNFAVQTGSGEILSGQLYRPPKPAQHQFSRLAAVIEDFFQGAPSPWFVRRSLLTAGLLGAFRTLSAGATQPLETPEL